MSSLPPSLPPPQPVPKRGLSGCAVAAIVSGMLFALVVIGVFAGGYFFMKQGGGRGAVTKAAIGMANPDYEIIDYNDKSKTITVRHKKTGKTATFPIAHMKNGHVDPADLGMTPDEAEGTGGAPSWVKYPRGKQVTAAQLMSITTLIYETDDPADRVMDYYKSIVKEQGLHTTTEQKSAVMVDDSKGSLQITTSEGGKGDTLITVVYRAK